VALPAARRDPGGSRTQTNCCLRPARSTSYTAWHAPHHHDQRSTRPQRQRVTTEWPSK
jgi:hypothetical protein